MVAESVELRPGWPGLQPDADEVRADPEVLDEVSRKLMAEHYAHLDGMTPGTLAFLGGERRDDAGWFGFWPTAECMQRGLEDARVVIRDYYRALDTQVEAAAELFAKTAEEYREVEQGLRDRLEATAEGWDRLAPPGGAPAGPGPSAEAFEQSAPIAGIPFTEDTSNYDADEIVARMNALREQRPWGMLNLRASTFSSVADRLGEIADTVWSQAQLLEDEWNSDTSAAAQRALQRLEATARHLAESSRRVARYAERSAEELERAAHDFPEDAGVPWWDDLNEIHHQGGPKITAKHNEIREKLAALNETYAHINSFDLPTQVSANLPQLTEMPPPDAEIWNPGSGSGGAGGGGYAPSMPPLDPSPPPGSGPVRSGASSLGVSDPGVGSPPHDSGFGGVSDVDQMDESGGGLAGVGPGAQGGVPGGGASVGGGGLGGTGAGAGAGGAAVGGASLPGGGLVSGGIGGRGAGGGRLSDGAGRSGAGGRGAGGAGGVGGRGVGGGVMGAPIAGAGAGSGESGSRGRSGGVAGGRPAGGAGGAGAGAAAGGGTGRGVAGGMMPMGGAGAGSDQERSRSDSWLVEDDDPWKVDDDVPPGVIR